VHKHFKTVSDRIHKNVSTIEILNLLNLITSCVNECTNPLKMVLNNSTNQQLTFSPLPLKMACNINHVMIPSSKITSWNILRGDTSFLAHTCSIREVHQNVSSRLASSSEQTFSGLPSPPLVDLIRIETTGHSNYTPG